MLCSREIQEVNFSPGELFTITKRLYSDLCNPECLPTTITYPKHFKPLIETFYKFVNQFHIQHGIDIVYPYPEVIEEKPIYDFFGYDSSIYDFKENKKQVLVGFSGGKDSLAVVTKLLEQKKEVILYHLKGINNTTSKREFMMVREVADYLGLELIVQEVKLKSRSGYKGKRLKEEPFKTQVIMAAMFDYGVGREITHYELGTVYEETLDSNSINPYHNFSDSVEANKLFDNVLKTYLPVYTRRNDFTKNSTDSLLQLARYDKKLLGMTSSCMGIPRNFSNSHKKNSTILGYELPKQRCGTCYKCAMTYLLEVEIGLKEKNEKYFKKCIVKLRDSTPDKKPGKKFKSLDQKSILRCWLDYELIREYIKERRDQNE